MELNSTSRRTLLKGVLAFSFINVSFSACTGAKERTTDKGTANTGTASEEAENKGTTDEGTATKRTATSASSGSQSQRLILRRCAKDSEASLSSVGGYPRLHNAEWPICGVGTKYKDRQDKDYQSACNRKMSLFLQLVLNESTNLPFEPGSQLSVFACPIHDDPSVGRKVIAPADKTKLPADYWNDNAGQYALYLFRPGVAQCTLGLDKRLVYSKVVSDNVESAGQQSLALGGTSGQALQCSCGAKMRPVCQIPENFEFPKQQSAEPQPNTYSDTYYYLFLGNITNIVACEAQCNSRAVFPIMHN